jgi:ribosomal protein L40E
MAQKVCVRCREADDSPGLRCKRCSGPMVPYDVRVCGECGRRVPPEASACVVCGPLYPVVVVPSEPSPADPGPEAALAPAVAPLALPYCTGCGTRLPEEAAFCPRCGTKRAAEAAAPAPTATAGLAAAPPSFPAPVGPSVPRWGLLWAGVALAFLSVVILWALPVVSIPEYGTVTVAHASALCASAVGGFVQALAPGVRSECSGLHAATVLLYLALAAGVGLGLVGLLWQAPREEGA